MTDRLKQAKQIKTGKYPAALRDAVHKLTGGNKNHIYPPRMGNIKCPGILYRDFPISFRIYFTKTEVCGELDLGQPSERILFHQYDIANPSFTFELEAEEIKKKIDKLSEGLTKAINTLKRHH